MHIANNVVTVQFGYCKAVRTSTDMMTNKNSSQGLYYKISAEMRQQSICTKDTRMTSKSLGMTVTTSGECRASRLHAARRSSTQLSGTLAIFCSHLVRPLDLPSVLNPT